MSGVLRTPAGPVRLYGPHFRSDPAGLYQQIRQQSGPVAPVLLEGDIPAWFVCGYREADQVATVDQFELAVQCEQIADQLIDEFSGSGKADLMSSPKARYVYTPSGPRTALRRLHRLRRLRGRVRQLADTAEDHQLGRGVGCARGCVFHDALHGEDGNWRGIAIGGCARSTADSDRSG